MPVQIIKVNIPATQVHVCVLLQMVSSACCWRVNSFRRTNHALSELRHQYQMALAVVSARLHKATTAVQCDVLQSPGSRPLHHAHDHTSLQVHVCVMHVGGWGVAVDICMYGVYKTLIEID